MQVKLKEVASQKALSATFYRIKFNEVKFTHNLLNTTQFIVKTKDILNWMPFMGVFFLIYGISVCYNTLVALFFKDSIGILNIFPSGLLFL